MRRPSTSIQGSFGPPAVRDAACRALGALRGEGEGYVPADTSSRARDYRRIPIQ